MLTTKFLNKAAMKLSRGYYRVPVRVLFNDSRSCGTIATLDVEVIAKSAAEAANWVRDNEPGVVGRPETEIHAWGPKGGHVERYIGWESSMGYHFFLPRSEAAAPKQLTMEI